MKKRNQNKSEQPLEMCSLDDAHRLFDEFFKSFDINDIPLSVRRKAVKKDYEEIYDDYRIASEAYLIELDAAKDGYEIINPFKDDAADTRYIIELLKEKYKMSDYQLKIVLSSKVQIVPASKIPNCLATTCSVLFPLVKNNADIIKKEMGKNGYYLVREGKYYDEDTDCDWTWLMFDPKRKEIII